MTKTKTKIDSYQAVTDKIISKLEKGIIPWRKPWTSGRIPCNFKTHAKGGSYRGVNLLLTLNEDWESPYYLTYKQASDLGGTVKKGSKGLGIVRWGQFSKEDPDTGEEKIGHFLKRYTIFNAEQIEGIEFPSNEIKTFDFKPLEKAEKIIEDWSSKPPILEGKKHAAYYSSRDEIEMPSRNRFEQSEEFYAVLFHEATHATGHGLRLKRKLGNKKGSTDYAKEELIAELGACFLCAQCGIFPTIEDNATAYIQSWLQALRNDKTLIVKASQQAQKAVDHILGVSWES